MSRFTVRDVMTSEVITVQPTTPLKTVARLLDHYGFRILPVVSRDMDVLGVVSERDFLIKQRGRSSVGRWHLGGFTWTGAEARRRLAKVEAVTAGEAMTSPAVTIDADAAVDEAAGRMLDNRVGSLPVVDDGRLVGILTRSDLVKLFTGSDDELAHSIREEVLQRTLLLPPGQFEVQVHNGIVHVRGHVERRALAELLTQTIARYPGVIRVESEISWLDDDRTESLRRVPAPR
jgi:CBS domain-containing protein